MSETDYCAEHPQTEGCQLYAKTYHAAPTTTELVDGSGRIVRFDVSGHGFGRC